MNEQAGPACALSVLIVGVFAVLLHDRDRGTSPPKPSLPSIARDLPRPRDPGPLTRTATPPPTPAPRIETSLEAPSPKDPGREPQSPRTEPTPTSEDRKSPGSAIGVVGLENSDLPRGQVPKLPGRSSRPRGDFTVVESGETLADVAERVYGSTRAAESLWKANRDQLTSLESPLQSGILLRTP
jgi:hypothetical protein